MYTCRGRHPHPKKLTLRAPADGKSFHRSNVGSLINDILTASWSFEESMPANRNYYMAKNRTQLASTAAFSSGFTENIVTLFRKCLKEGPQKSLCFEEEAASKFNYSWKLAFSRLEVRKPVVRC